MDGGGGEGRQNGSAKQKGKGQGRQQLLRSNPTRQPDRAHASTNQMKRDDFPDGFTHKLRYIDVYLHAYIYIYIYIYIYCSICTSINSCRLGYLGVGGGEIIVFRLDSKGSNRCCSDFISSSLRIHFVATLISPPTTFDELAFKFCCDSVNIP